MGKQADVSNPPPEVRDNTSPQTGPSSQLSSSIDFTRFQEAISETLKQSAAAAVEAYGDVEWTGLINGNHAGTSGAGSADVNPGAGHGVDGEQVKPRPEFDPDAGGGCFGIPGLPERVLPSHGGKLIPVDINKPPVDGDDGGEITPAPTHRPTGGAQQKPVEYPNPLVEDGCFGDYFPDADSDGQIKSGGKGLNTDGEIKTEVGNPAADMVRDAIKTLGNKVGIADPSLTTTGEMMRTIAAKITEAWDAQKVLNDSGVQRSDIKDKRSLFDGVAKEQFDAALKTLESELGSNFQESQRLAREVFDAVADKKFDPAKMRDSVMKAAAELSANPDSPETKTAMEALRNALARGGVNAEIGPNGLNISDGRYSLQIDGNGNLNGYMNSLDPDSAPISISAEAALRGLHHSYVQTALSMNQMRQTVDHVKGVLSEIRKTAPNESKKEPHGGREIPQREDEIEWRKRYLQ